MERASQIPPSDRGSVKGVAIREFLEYLDQRDGVTAVRERLLALPEELRNQLRLDAPGCGILAGSWYSNHLVHPMLDAVLAGKSPEERRAVAVEGDRAVMAATFGGIYRGLFQLLATPNLVARHAQTVWNKYYSDGEVDVDPVGPPESCLIIRGWKGFHPLIAEMTAEGFRIIYEGLGYRDAKSELLAGASAREVRIRVRFGYTR
ncbi:MAG: hypothetical protein H6722_18120 [Sandaracinus sp.]|nr:hypothetical protein [Sandaracinus sp.]